MLPLFLWEMGGVAMPEVNKRGNTVIRRFHSTERYLFDFRLCTPKKGWKQYDTNQDAWYFGVWVNRDKRVILTYAEGDITVVKCPAEDNYHAELRHMDEFYGPPPPACVTIDYPTGKRTEYYDERPV